MRDIDLSDYNLAELKGLQLAVTLELRQRQLLEQRRAREQIAAIARALGLSVRDVLRR
jgi:DNA-binding protein H-NS